MIHDGKTYHIRINVRIHVNQLAQYLMVIITIIVKTCAVVLRKQLQIMQRYWYFIHASLTGPVLLEFFFTESCNFISSF